MINGRARGRAIAGLAALGVIGASSVASAQGPGAVKTIGAAIVIDHLVSQDRLVSPRTYRGMGVGQLELDVSIRSERTAHEISGRFGTMEVASGSAFDFRRGSRLATTQASETERVELSYAHERRFSTRAWMGVSVTGRATHTKYELGTGAAEGYLYYAAFEVSGRYGFPLGRGRSLSLTVRMPVVGWVARPTYSTVDEARLQSASSVWYRLEHGEPFAPWDLQAVAGQASYVQALGGHFGLLARLGLAYVRTVSAEGFRSLRTGIDIGVFVRWPGRVR